MWNLEFLANLWHFKFFYGPEIVKLYSTDQSGPKMYGNIQEKQCYGPVMIKL